MAFMRETVTRDTSKDVYISEPNATKLKFDVVTIESNESVSGKRGSYSFFCYNFTNNIIDMWDNNNIYTSTTQPTGIPTTSLWYDISNNKFKVTKDAGSTWTEIRLSLPFCICSYDTYEISSIDQVFNGFGYIGSTVFALPGVKGLMPNGRNADGSLKNIELNITAVQIHDNISDGNNVQEEAIVLNGSGYPLKRAWLGTSDLGLPVKNDYAYYNQADNQNYYGNGWWVKETVGLIGFFSADSGKITSFTFKTAFHTLDYNDKSTVSGWSMPSSRYIDLTLGASGSTYTAPANGWFSIAALGSDSLDIVNLTLGYGYCFSSRGDKFVRAILPINKGSQFSLYFSPTFTRVDFFRFIYAEGEN